MNKICNKEIHVEAVSVSFNVVRLVANDLIKGKRLWYEWDLETGEYRWNVSVSDYGWSEWAKPISNTSCATV